MNARHAIIAIESDPDDRKSRIDFMLSGLLQQ
jgi:hypothetical protein